MVKHVLELSLSFKNVKPFSIIISCVINKTIYNSFWWNNNFVLVSKSEKSTIRKYSGF